MATDEENTYFAVLDGIAAELDAIAKAVTADMSDDAEPAPAPAEATGNAYFTNLGAIRSALARLKDAAKGRLDDIGARKMSEPINRGGRFELRNGRANIIYLADATTFTLPPATPGMARDIRLDVGCLAACSISLELASGDTLIGNNAGLFTGLEGGKFYEFWIRDFIPGKVAVTRTALWTI